jgi:hypothetical protein
VLTALVIAAALAGVAGSWSPCGLSMIETLGRRPLATATFALGTLAGGALTFGGLAWLGTQLLGPLAALAISALLIAALGDAAGRRIVPQIRRQVPESWRRFLPVPLATGLYGVLLGLGFTTFLLTYATWALAAVCLAIGEPSTGLAVGLAFGAGRALPVALLGDSHLLAERPELLRGLRGVTAVALLAAAGLLAAAPPSARAATVVTHRAYDPSASGALFAYESERGNGVLVRDGDTIQLPGSHPAVSGTEVAWVNNDAIVVGDTARHALVLIVPAPGADAVALSPTDVAWRAGDRILAVDRSAPTTPVEVARGAVGRPTLRGARVVYDQQSRRASRIRSFDVDTGERRTLRRTTGAQLLAPTLTDRGLLYVRSTYARQRLVLRKRVVYSTTATARRDKGYEDGHHPHHQGYPEGRRPKLPPRPRAGHTVTLWTTAFARETAYVTHVRHLRGGRTRSTILRVSASP